MTINTAAQAGASHVHKAAATPSARARQTRTIVLAGVLALIVLCLAWELWLAPTGQGTLAIKVLPLLPALPGLWRYRLYTFRWLSLLVWVYFSAQILLVGAEFTCLYARTLGSRKPNSAAGRQHGAPRAPNSP